MRENEKSLPELAQWDTYSSKECEEIAATILERIPASFQYEKMEEYALGDQRHRVLLFTWQPFSTQQEPLRFAFIPGGEMILGYDQNNPFLPTESQAKSWQEETFEGGFTTDTLDEFLAKTMSPLRQVKMKPFLFQVTASATEKPPIPGFRRQSFVLFEEIHEIVAAGNFRLPSSDEWEYACAAGSRTLFRWGNMTPPCHLRLPHPDDDEEDIVEMDWKEHLKPNAFGLLIAQNPYHCEVCAEPGMMRGGDGGTATHSGAGTFAEWLMLATPLYHKLDDWSMERKGTSLPYLRRVYPL